MTNDLASEIRRLIDVAPPVTADEAASFRATPGASSARRDARTRGVARPLIAVAASVVVLGALAAVVGVRTIGSGPAPRGATAPVHAILSDSQVSTITAKSSAAASSGTAEVTQFSAQDGVAQGGYDTAVTFSGSNIDEKITSVPVPSSSAGSFTTDDRYVGGQFYIYTPGPRGVAQWLHDTNSASDAASMQFPDPRTLYGAMSPAAQFAVEGTSSQNGETVTHLVATNPDAIDASALGNLVVGATITSFDLWIDQGDVVQRIAFSTSQSTTTCNVGPLSDALVRSKSLKNAKSFVIGAGTKGCRSERVVSNVAVVFAGLGDPQSIAVPQGALDFAGKG